MSHARRLTPSSHPRRPHQRLTRVGMGVVAAAVLAGCSNSTSAAETSATSTATNSSSGAVTSDLVRGRLLTTLPLTGAAALPSAARNTLITYVSSGPDGQPAVVSGTVSVPQGTAPDGGWPVLNWAHGTTGWADTCAPSLDTVDGPEHDYLGGVSDVIDTWVAQGYAVVRTDYVGLGTPGGHPYLDGNSEANAVIDVLRAARSLDSSIGARWVVGGHSQGGQAALFTAAVAADQAPDLPLLGVVAVAPGGVGVGEAVAGLADGQGSDALEAFIPVILLGAQSAGIGIDPDQLLSDQARSGLAVARSQCLGQGRDVPTVPIDQYLAPGADLSPVVDHLERQDPRTITPRVPVMIAQGTADTVVPLPGTQAVATQYCGKDVTVDLHLYDGQDHRGAVPASAADAQAFAAAVFAGTPITRQCTGQ